MDRYVFHHGEATAASGDAARAGTIVGATTGLGRDASGALAMDGDGDYVEFPAALTADLAGARPRTICVWARLDRVAGATLFDFGDAGPGRDFGLWWPSATTLRVQFYGDVDVDVAMTVDDDWHHYCLAYDGASYAFYFDGAVKSTGARALDTGTANALRVGGGVPTHFGDLLGVVDEVAVYRVALDAAAVAAVRDGYGIAPTRAPTPTPTAAPTPTPTAAPTSFAIVYTVAVSEPDAIDPAELQQATYLAVL